MILSCTPQEAGQTPFFVQPPTLPPTLNPIRSQPGGEATTHAKTSADSLLIRRGERIEPGIGERKLKICMRQPSSRLFAGEPGESAHGAASRSLFAIPSRNLPTPLSSAACGAAVRPRGRQRRREHGEATGYLGPLDFYLSPRIFVGPHLSLVFLGPDLNHMGLNKSLI
jgi:hypothetical protein